MVFVHGLIFFNLKCSKSIFGLSPTKILGYLRMLSRPQSDEGVWREVKSHKIHGINDGNSLGFWALEYRNGGPISQEVPIIPLILPMVAACSGSSISSKVGVAVSLAEPAAIFAYGEDGVQKDWEAALTKWALLHNHGTSVEYALLFWEGHQLGRLLN